jgi:alkylhydroperoxidase family enzyme
MPYITDDVAGHEAQIALAEVQARRGFVSNVHRTLAHTPAGLRAFESFSAHVNGSSRLDARTRELVILRVAQVVGNLYEWRRHVPKAEAAGVHTAELEALARADPQPFAPIERDLLTLVDRHARSEPVPPELIARLRAAYGEELVVEILLTLGWYLLVASVIVPLDIVADDPASEPSVAFSRSAPLATA